MVVFKTKVLHFKIESTPIKDINGKRKLKGMLSFLFVDKGKLFVMKFYFEEFNLVFFKARFLKKLQAYSVPYGQEKVLKGNFLYL